MKSFSNYHCLLFLQDNGKIEHFFIIVNSELELLGVETLVLILLNFSLLVHQYIKTNHSRLSDLP